MNRENRRQFLHQATRGLAGLAALAPHSLRANPLGLPLASNCTRYATSWKKISAGHHQEGRGHRLQRSGAVCIPKEACCGDSPDTGR